MDRATIWEKLSDLTREHDFWTYVHTAQTPKMVTLDTSVSKATILELIMFTTCQLEWKERLRQLTIVQKSTTGTLKSMSSYTMISTRFSRDLLNMDMLVLMLG